MDNSDEATDEPAENQPILTERFDPVEEPPPQDDPQPPRGSRIISTLLLIALAGVIGVVLATLEQIKMMLLAQ